MSVMEILCLRDVPDEVVARLQRLADRAGMSVGAFAVRELTEVSRRADDAALLGVLPDLGVGPTSVVAALEEEREAR